MLGTLLCFSIWNVTGSFAIGVTGAVLVAALGGGFATEWLLRPLYGRPMLFQLLLTMGVGYVLQDVFLFAWGNRLISAKVPDSLSFLISIGNFKFPFFYVFLIIISLIVCGVMFYVFKGTKIGMYFRAIITHKDMVACMGVNVKALNSVMFMIGVGLSALAGALNLPLTGTSTAAESSIMFTIMSILIIGGIFELKGAFFGSMLVGVISSFGAMFLSQYYSILPAALMVIVLIVKPEGICGKKEAV
jgi:branched-subunit amino acid ABC-type transport system permease component